MILHPEGNNTVEVSFC